MKYEDGMLILGQNDVFCGHSVVNFSVWFLQLTVSKYLVASHVTESGSLLTELWNERNQIFHIYDVKGMVRLYHVHNILRICAI